MQVSIIIVNYNTKDITNDCINSIISHTKDLGYEIILVDNGSKDGSKEYFEERRDITYIYSIENLGFGKANNLGAEKAKGELLFLLNSDTILIENSIKKMFDFFCQNEEGLKIGVLGCLLIDDKYEINGYGDEFPSCKKEISNYLSLIPITNFFVKKEKRKPIELTNDYFEIDYVIGADMLMRKKNFLKLNGFDEDFFMYYEESDLQKRMSNLLGVRNFIYTKTRIIHLEDASGKNIKRYTNKKRIIVHKSKNLYLKKNDFENFKLYKIYDNLFLWLSKFNKKYTKQEYFEYFTEIKKTHL
ncbi:MULTISPECIES: glycosyltransferase family 2 protein [unclassified Chryseobacterium]|uniref:glycosyltransferase family 2 protein n=1 Tax=unclassified Chryseobacterium TaxID=2593645 RepID=UPI00301947A3